MRRCCHIRLAASPVDIEMFPGILARLLGRENTGEVTL
jgi:hypothetical protein